MATIRQAKKLAAGGDDWLARDDASIAVDQPYDGMPLSSVSVMDWVAVVRFSGQDHAAGASRPTFVRIHKDQLKLRSVWHQREDRVQACILACFLAFVRWKSLEMWQQRAGLGNSPRGWATRTSPRHDSLQRRLKWRNGGRRRCQGDPAIKLL
jgi:hypothetical protein